MAVGDKKVKVVFDLETTGFMRGLRNINAKIDESRRKAQASYGALSSSIANVGRSMMLVSAAIIGVGVVAVKMAADFERAMNRVAAVSGATGTQLDALKEQAKELGRTTMFSASQAADAMGFLAMAGFEVNEIMGAMPSTLQLAASAQMDLAQAADITSNILTGYRMTVDELAHANDVLVKTFVSTNTNLAQLGEAMKYAAPVAASAGIQFEEAAAAIGLMGNAGIQGSLAGTSLRGAIVRLLTPGGAASAVMENLGIQVMDATGNLLPFVNIIEQLETSGATTADMMTIFGLRAGPALAALVAQGSGALRELTGELVESGGTAQEIADKQMEGLHGQILKLKSAFEGMMIAIAEAGLIQWVVEMAEKITAWFTSMAEADKQMLRTIIVIGLVVAAIGPLLMVLSQIIMIAPAVGTAATIMFGPWGIIIAAVVAAIATVVTAISIWTAHQRDLNESIEEAVSPIREETKAMKNQRTEILKLTGEVHELTRRNDESAGSFEMVRDKVIALSEDYPDYIEKLGITISETGELYNANGDVITSTLELNRVLNSFDTSSFVRELSQAITEADRLSVAIEGAIRMENAWMRRAAAPFRAMLGMGPTTVGIREEYGPGGVTYTPVEVPASEEELRAGIAALSEFTGAVEDAAAVIEDEIVIPDPDEIIRRAGGGAAARAVSETVKETRNILWDNITETLEGFGEMMRTIARAVRTEDYLGVDVLQAEIAEALSRLLKIEETLDPKERHRRDREIAARKRQTWREKIQAKLEAQAAADEAIEEAKQEAIEEAETIAEAAMSFFDILENVFLKGVRRLGEAIGRGNIAQALTQVFDMLGNAIATHIETRIAVQIPGLFGGLLGGFAGGVISGIFSLFGGGRKSPGTSRELPIYASITNWNEMNLGAYLPFTFMASGRSGVFDVDWRGVSLDQTRHGRRLGWHYAQ